MGRSRPVRPLRTSTRRAGEASATTSRHAATPLCETGRMGSDPRGRIAAIVAGVVRAAARPSRQSPPAGGTTTPWSRRSPSSAGRACGRGSRPGRRPRGTRVQRERAAAENPQHRGGDRNIAGQAIGEQRRGEDGGHADGRPQQPDDVERVHRRGQREGGGQRRRHGREQRCRLIVHRLARLEEHRVRLGRSEPHVAERGGVPEVHGDRGRRADDRDQHERRARMPRRFRQRHGRPAAGPRRVSRGLRRRTRSRAFRTRAGGPSRWRCAGTSRGRHGRAPSHSACR